MIFYNKEENRLRAGWRIGITTILIISVLIVWAFLVSAQTGIMIGLAVIVLAVLWFSSTAIDKRPFDEFGFKLTANWFRDFIAGNLMAAFAMGGLVFVLVISGHASFTDTSFSFNSREFLFGLTNTLILMIAVSIWEEAYFRSYLISNLREGFHNRWISKQNAVIGAVLASSVIFGFAHTTNPHSSWIALTNITVAGIILAYPYIITKSIAISVGMHLSWNYFQGVVFGLPVSGIRMDESIISTSISGPELITGGEFGPEGGFIGFSGLILLAALCHKYLIIYYKK